MSAITPQTELRLLKCPIENDNRNQINFATTTAQYNYFNSLPSLTVDNFTYQRKDGIIRYPEHIDNIIEYNYVMYQNEAYSNKWFYAFITNMEYVNDKMTYITIKTDVFQTWQFDLTYKKSFVEREHVNDDTVGKHTVPEGLETGEYIGSDPMTLTGESNSEYIIFQVIDETSPNESDPWEAPKTRYGGVYSGAEYLVFDIDNAGRFIRYMNQKDKIKYIVNIFMYYGNLDLGDSYYILDQGSIVCEYTEVQTSSSSKWQTGLKISQGKPTQLGQYTPKNKKLLTYPYTYLLANNYAGTTKVYRYEDFEYDIEFSKISNLCVGGSFMYFPYFYKIGRYWGGEYNWNEGFVGGKFPSCCWTTDGYTNWLTQQAVNEKYQYGRDAAGMFIGGATTALGLATGNPLIAVSGATNFASALGGTANDVLNNIQAREQHQIAPLEISGYANGGDAIYGHNRCVPVFVNMFIKEEYAKIIDNYFDMYGYKVNLVKVPNITSRSNWNYIKTVNVNIEADIPDGDLQEIRNMFNNGITFWHKTNYYLDYSQSNTIV